MPIALLAVLAALASGTSARAQAMLGAKDSRSLSLAECRPSPPRQTVLLIDFAHVTRTSESLARFVAGDGNGLISESLMLPGEPYHLIFFDSRISGDIDVHIAGCFVGPKARSAPGIRDPERLAQVYREQDSNFIAAAMRQVVVNSPPRPSAGTAKKTHYLSVLARVTNELYLNAETSRFFILGDLSLYQDTLDRKDWSVGAIAAADQVKIAKRLRFRRAAVRVFGFAETLNGSRLNVVRELWRDIIARAGGHLTYFGPRYPGVENLRPSQRPPGMAAFFSGDGLLGLANKRFEPLSTPLKLYLNIRDDRDAFVVDWLALSMNGSTVNLPMLGGMSCGGGTEQCLYEGSLQAVPDAYARYFQEGSNVRLAVGDLAYGHVSHRVSDRFGREHDLKSEIIAANARRRE